MNDILKLLEYFREAGIEAVVQPPYILTDSHKIRYNKAGEIIEIEEIK